MKASCSAASYRAATCRPSIRSSGLGSTARCAASATTRADARRSPLRRTIWLMKRASTETVNTVSNSVTAGILWSRSL